MGYYSMFVKGTSSLGLQSRAVSTAKLPTPNATRFTGKDHSPAGGSDSYDGKEKSSTDQRKQHTNYTLPPGPRDHQPNKPQEYHYTLRGRQEGRPYQEGN